MKDAKPAIQKILLPDEKILWSGKPVRSRFLIRNFSTFLSPLLTIPIIYLIITHNIFHSADLAYTIVHKASILTIFQYAAFILLLYITTPFFTYFAEQNVSYVLTNQRVIGIKKLFGCTVSHIPLSTIGDITKHTNSDESGTLIFRKKGQKLGIYKYQFIIKNNFATKQKGLILTPPLAFIDIPNVQRVYNLIKETREQYLNTHPTPLQQAQQTQTAKKNPILRRITIPIVITIIAIHIFNHMAPTTKHNQETAKHGRQ